MATQTGSIDLKAQKAAHDEAAKTATSFIAEVTNGVMVHPEGDSTTGWRIADALELLKSGVTYIKAWVESGVAKLRLGKEDDSHVLIESGKITLADSNGSEAFQVNETGEGVGRPGKMTSFAHDSDTYWKLELEDRWTDFRGSPMRIAGTVSVGDIVNEPWEASFTISDMPASDIDEWFDMAGLAAHVDGYYLEPNTLMIGISGSGDFDTLLTVHITEVVFGSGGTAPAMRLAGRNLLPAYSFDTLPSPVDVPVQPSLVLDESDSSLHCIVDGTLRRVSAYGDGAGISGDSSYIYLDGPSGSLWRLDKANGLLQFNGSGAWKTVSWSMQQSRTANTVLAAPNGEAGAASFRKLAAADVPSLPASKIDSGTLALARGGTASDNTARSANTVLAGPSSGAAGNASWRKLVAADVPNLNASKVTAGTLAQARGGTGASSLYKVVTATSSSKSCTASASTQFDVALTVPDGYTPVAFKRVTTSHVSAVPKTWSISDSTAVVLVRNVASSAVSSTVTVGVLCLPTA